MEFNFRKKFKYDAIDEILNFYKIPTRKIPPNLKSDKQKITFLLNCDEILSRKILLKKNWRKEAIGAILAFNEKENKIVALTPKKTTGYHYKNQKTGKYIKITKKNELMFCEKAFMFYKAFPLKILTTKDILKHIFSYIPTFDYFLIFLTSSLTTLIGLLLPKINKIFFSTVIKLYNLKILAYVSIFLFCTLISKHILNIFKNLLCLKITMKLNIKIKTSTFLRILYLPAEFFNKHRTCEIFSKINILENFYKNLIENFLQTILTSFFCIFYLLQIFSFTPSLVRPAILTISLISIFAIISALIQKDIGLKKLNAITNEQTISFFILNNLKKIKLTGSEKRIFSIWLNNFSKKAKIIYNPPFFIKTNEIILNLIILTGTIFIYFIAAKEKIQPSDFFSFTTSYAVLISGFKNFHNILLNIAKSKPVLKLIDPILKTKPEETKNKKIITNPTGEIKIQNLHFAYGENSKKIFNNFNLKIKPGELVAVTGKSGHGKSTLLKLLIGFEKQNKGEIYIDNVNTKTLNFQIFRKSIGIVTNNSKLVYGSIFENISFATPKIKYDEIIKIIKLIDLYDEIKKMPLALDTLVSENTKNISNSQKQKILIARAIAKKPNIFLLDEATCFLDCSTKIKLLNFLQTLNATKIFFTYDETIIKKCKKKIYL